MYKFSDSIDLLIDKFPIFKKTYEEDIDYYKDIPYVFYNDTLGQYVLDRVSARDEDELIVIFDYIEDMFLHGDEYVINMVGVVIVEDRFFYDMYCKEELTEYTKYLSQFFGELTMKSFKECTGVF